MTGTPAIQTRQLTKTYDVGFVKRRRVKALQGLDLSVEPGQIFGILGPNGAGKSTTIKLLLNLIRPTSGSALVFGHEPASVEGRRQIGFLPENPAPYEYLTGREFVGFCGQLAGLSGAALSRRVETVIGQVGMTDAADLQVRRYSKGMIQRISLAQSLVGEPKLLILDEPTSGLDVLGRQLIRDIVLEERRKGTTVLFCSHIIPDVEALCDRVAVLIGGRLVTNGTVSELLAGGGGTMEMTLEEVDADAFRAAVGDRVSSIEQLGGRLLVKFDEARQADVLGAALSVKARVAHVQRARYTLEELFIRTIKESGQSVGSQIS